MPTTTQTDTNNEFDWTTIETTTNEDGSLFRIVTVYDNGLVRTEYFTDDLLSSVIEDDTNSNLHPWASQSTTYDASGQVTNLDTTFDDGTSRYETYVDGVISLVIENDWGATNNHPWDRIQTEYDASGQITRQVTTFDDTSRRIDYYNNGQLSTSQQLDTTDNAAPWDMIQRDYDATTGDLIRKTTTYDDGVKRIEEFENGVRIAHQLRDIDNVKTFDTIDYYENPADGSLTKITQFDNGNTREENFSNGLRVNTIETDLDDGAGGNASWDNIATYYDAIGELEARITTFDSGATREQLFQNGVRTRTVDTDVDDGAGGAAPWSTVESYYDVNGDLEAKITTFDNGSTREELYAGGQRTRTVSVDGAGPDTAYAWDRIESYFDLNGKLEAKITTNDDGTAREELFSNGLRVRTTQNDVDDGGAGQFAWDQIVTYYDTAGELEARVMNYDDGRTREDTYDFGAVAQSLETDNSPDGTAHDWSSINTYYEDGQRLARTTLYDNGVTRTEEYAEGVRSQIIEEDGSTDGSARNFQTKQTVFDSTGQIMQRLTTLDDGVSRTEDFVNGTRSRTVEQDLNDTNSWQYRSTDFDANGVVTQRDQLGDDGVQRADIYVNGLRTERIVSDGDNLYDWTGRLTKFDQNNQRVESRTIYDNQDELLELYIEGQRYARIEVDNDGSDPWGARLSEYNSDGSLSATTEYDNVTDLPQQYSGYFDTGGGGEPGGGGGDFPVGVG